MRWQVRRVSAQWHASVRKRTVMRHNGRMEDQEVTLVVAAERFSDPELLEASVLSLREELLDIPGIRDLMPRGTGTPPRSKGGPVELVGTMLMAIPASMPVLRELRITLHDWLHRNDGKQVRLEINGVVVDATGLSDDTLEKLVIRGIASDGDS
jgi:hypothetical protein